MPSARVAALGGVEDSVPVSLVVDDAQLRYFHGFLDSRKYPVDAFDGRKDLRMDGLWDANCVGAYMIGERFEEFNHHRLPKKGSDDVLYTDLEDCGEPSPLLCVLFVMRQWF